MDCASSHQRRLIRPFEGVHWPQVRAEQRGVRHGTPPADPNSTYPGGVSESDHGSGALFRTRTGSEPVHGCRRRPWSRPDFWLRSSRLYNRAQPAPTPSLSWRLPTLQISWAALRDDRPAGTASPTTPPQPPGPRPPAAATSHNTVPCSPPVPHAARTPRFPRVPAHKSDPHASPWTSDAQSKS
jgi:hypothetical protein